MQELAGLKHFLKQAARGAQEIYLSLDAGGEKRKLFLGADFNVQPSEALITSLRQLSYTRAVELKN